MSAVPNVPEGLHGSKEKDLENVLTEALHKNQTSTNGRIDSPTANGVTRNGIDAAGFRVHDAVVENLRPIRVIVIGAGYSGIYHGIRIPERLRNCELVIYEKNAGVGGTWYENRYPGCACDIPSHSYQYSFNPNPNWSALYAPAQEIRAYLEDTVKKYSVQRFIELRHEVQSCRFDAEAGKWHVSVWKLDDEDGEKEEEKEVFEDTADVVVMARGGLNHISWPKIPGFESFRGEVMHSAKWNEDYDFTNKRIGIIGSGSSAIQIIPSLQRLPSTHLSCFIRGRTWISPPFGAKIQDSLSLTSPTFTQSQKDRFNTDAEHFLTFRMQIEEAGNEIHALTIKGTAMQKAAQSNFETNMKERLAEKPQYYEWLKPEFAPGCRRLTPGPGFLEALVQDNVSFVRAPITRVTEKGVVTEDGETHEIDVLVCATGFHTGAPPPFPVTGLDGKTLQQSWSDRAQAYLSLATDGFPNMFMMLGPNSAIGSGSLTIMIESVGDYAIKCIRKLQKENVKSMVVKTSAVRDFLEYADAYFKGTVFMDECRSWYRKGDKITGLWPGSALHCIEALRSPRWEDFEYEYREGNRLAWLGNGWSVNEVEARDRAWYLLPQFQSVPNAPLPEEHADYRIRAFSQ